MIPKRAYLCLGANMGDARKNLEAARARLMEGGVVIEASSALYRTPAWGPIAQDAYLNQVLAVRSPLPARALLQLALDIERAIGRDRAREIRYGPRVIDIDILLFEGERSVGDELHLPHPRLMERAFALAPLVEIAPDLCIDGLRVADVLARLDASGIERLPFETNANQTDTILD